MTSTGHVNWSGDVVPDPSEPAVTIVLRDDPKYRNPKLRIKGQHRMKSVSLNSPREAADAPAPGPSFGPAERMQARLAICARAVDRMLNAADVGWRHEECFAQRDAQTPAEAVELSDHSWQYKFMVELKGIQAISAAGDSFSTLRYARKNRHQLERLLEEKGRIASFVPAPPGYVQPAPEPAPEPEPEPAPEPEPEPDPEPDTSPRLPLRKLVEDYLAENGPSTSAAVYEGIVARHGRTSRQSVNNVLRSGTIAHSGGTFYLRSSRPEPPEPDEDTPETQGPDVQIYPDLDLVQQMYMAMGDLARVVVAVKGLVEQVRDEQAEIVSRIASLEASVAGIRSTDPVELGAGVVEALVDRLDEIPARTCAAVRAEVDRISPDSTASRLASRLGEISKSMAELQDLVLETAAGGSK